jgi:hypothetical protein
MSTYATLAVLKSRLGVADTSQDDILTAALNWSDALINAACDRRFSAATATRYFGPDRIDWDGNLNLVPIGYRSIELPYKRLFLDDDLLVVTTLTNGDGTVIPSNGYFLEPFNAPADSQPYSSILLKSSYAWTWDTDGRVSVAGSWGYSSTADSLVVGSALVFSEWMYRARAPQDVTTIFDNQTKKVKAEGFPQAALDALMGGRRRLAR